MIEKLRLVNNSQEKEHSITLHSEVTDILFKHRCHVKNIYASHIFGLIDIGDYFCNSVLDIYSEYCGNHSLPKLNQLNSKATELNTRSILKLIVNNS